MFESNSSRLLYLSKCSDVPNDFLRLDGLMSKATPCSLNNLQMGDFLAEVTEENRDAAQISKSQAMDAISEGIYNQHHNSN